MDTRMRKAQVQSEVLVQNIDALDYKQVQSELHPGYRLTWTINRYSLLAHPQFRHDA